MKMTQIPDKFPTLTQVLPYVIITINYNTKILFRVAQGLEFLQMLAAGTPLESKYGAEPKIVDKITEEITVQFVGEDTVRMMKMDQVIDP